MKSYVIWDPGATSDMGSIAAVLAIDKELRKRTGGRLFGKWYKPRFPRRFRVANGQTVPAVFEVEFEIPLKKTTKRD